MIINGYLLNLCNYRHFLFYLIQNNIKLKDFDKFAQEETNTLCNHIYNYIKENNVETIYLNSGKIDENEIVINELEKNPNKIGLIISLSAVEICNTMTVKPNHETEKLEVTSRATKWGVTGFSKSLADGILNQKISDSFELIKENILDLIS